MEILHYEGLAAREWEARSSADLAKLRAEHKHVTCMSIATGVRHTGVPYVDIGYEARALDGNELASG